MTFALIYIPSKTNNCFLLGNNDCYCLYFLVCTFCLTYSKGGFPQTKILFETKKAGSFFEGTTGQENLPFHRFFFFLKGRNRKGHKFSNLSHRFSGGKLFCPVGTSGQVRTGRDTSFITKREGQISFPLENLRDFGTGQKTFLQKNSHLFLFQIVFLLGKPSCSNLSRSFYKFSSGKPSGQIRIHCLFFVYQALQKVVSIIQFLSLLRIVLEVICKQGQIDFIKL